MDEKKGPGGKKTWTEEIEIAGGQVIERVKALIAEGNVRELRVKAAGGQVIFETPVTVGVLAGGAVALAAPWLAILGAIAALVARVKIEVVREGPARAKTAKKATKKAAAKKTAKKPVKKSTAKPKRTATVTRKRSTPKPPVG